MFDSKTDKYGNYYYGVLVTREVSKDGEIFVSADGVNITDNGTLVFWRKREAGNLVNLAIAADKWISYYAASVIDGSPVAIEHWSIPISKKDGILRAKEDSDRIRERGKLNNSLRYDVLKRDGFKCVACGANGGEKNLEVDHIMPISRGGKTQLDNLQTLCKECNRGKSTKYDV